MSYSADYIITTVSSSSEQRLNNSIGSNFQAPFSLTMPGPISLRGTGLPYYATPAPNPLGSFPRKLTIPLVGATDGSWVTGKS